VKVKIKQSHYRPVQTLRVPGGWGSQISWQSAHEGGKVVSPTYRSPLPRKYSWYSFLSWPQGHIAAGRIMSMKNEKKKPSGIEPVTFRLLAQGLNQLCHRMPLQDVKLADISGTKRGSSWKVKLINLIQIIRRRILETCIVTSLNLIRVTNQELI